jgi:hypothetical protein
MKVQREEKLQPGVGNPAIWSGCSELQKVPITVFCLCPGGARISWIQRSSFPIMVAVN